MCSIDPRSMLPGDHRQDVAAPIQQRHGRQAAKVGARLAVTLCSIFRVVKEC